MNIIIVEDCKIMQLNLKLGLSKLGFNIIGTADNENSAVPLILNNDVDVVLMDVELNNSCGLDIIKTVAPHTKAKFIVLTMHKSEEEFLSVLDSNTYAYCNKSLPIDYIGKIIKQVYNGEYWIDPLLE